MGSAMMLHSRVTKAHVTCSTFLLRSKDTRKYTVLVESLQVSGHPDSKTITPLFRIIPYCDFQGNA